MRHPIGFTAALSFGFIMLVLSSGCSSNALAERPAARQQTLVAYAAAQETPQESPQEAAPEAGEDKPGDTEKGKELFEQCVICHSIDSDEEKMGPQLKGLFKKEKLQNGKEANEESIRAVINEGGNGMPGYEDMLTAEEMKDLIAYLRTI